MHKRIGLSVLFAFGAIGTGLPAQDAIGVTFAGQVLRLDTVTGAVTVLANGTAGKNCLTYDNDNRLWTAVRPNPLTSVYRLALINPFTGAETLPFPTVNVGDLRGMCIARAAGGVFAIRDASPTDELIHIDTDSGFVTLVGATNHVGIQGLEDPFGGGKAWDANAGLLFLDLNTGHTNDPFTTVVDPAGLQFLCRHPVSNERFVGRGSLYRLNTSNGTTTLVVNFAGNPDVRGMEFTASRVEGFGLGCPGAVGNPFLNVPTPWSGGQTLVTQSNAHSANDLGVLVIGFSEDVYAGAPLPLSLDPLLGTNGCFLNVSADLLLLGIADSTGLLQVGVFVPSAIAFQQFYVQHATLENVPGGFSMTRGLRVRSAL